VGNRLVARQLDVALEAPRLPNRRDHAPNIAGIRSSPPSACAAGEGATPVGGRP
jgi:hypothetical protein